MFGVKLNWKQLVLLALVVTGSVYFNFKMWDYVAGSFEDEFTGKVAASLWTMAISYLVGTAAGKNAWRLE